MTSKSSEPKDARCRYAHDAQRCPMPASWFPGIEAKGLCHYHSDEGNQGHDSRQDVVFSVLAKDLHCQLDWASGWYKPHAADECAALAEEETSWRRGDREGASAYRERIMALCRELSSGVGRADAPPPMESVEAFPPWVQGRLAERHALWDGSQRSLGVSGEAPPYPGLRSSPPVRPVLAECVCPPGKSGWLPVPCDQCPRLGEVT